MLKSINDNKDEINPLFLSGVEEFKRLLWNVLVPKNSFNDGELVTGEGEYGISQGPELHLLMSTLLTYSIYAACLCYTSLV